METIMKQQTLIYPALSSTELLRRSRWAFAAIAALAFAVYAFHPAKAAAATASDHATYCLSSDSQSQCGFTSLAQCEATASGGLGVCNMVPAMSDDLGSFRRAHAQMSGALPRR
jgi:Protein of unknown function (DUF3551)